MAHLTLGILADSKKKDEFRLPIHPDHIARIPAELRARITVESGYGARFGETDARLAELVGAVAARSEVIAASDIVLLPKPILADLADLREGQILWGWPHVLQDTDNPLMFVSGDEIADFAPGSLIVDVSCDAGMAFDFARPTSFADRMFTVGEGVSYYAVDHSPSYLWNSTTWVISEALLPYLPTVMGGPKEWEAERTIAQAIEIRDGSVVNPRILSFQDRAAEFPHELQ